MSNTTVLDIVQEILSSINGDEVNSLNDSVEALQIAYIVKEVYENLVDEYDLQSVKGLFILDSLADPSKPTLMLFPEGSHSIDWIKYNAKDLDGPDKWVVVHFLPPGDFVHHVHNFPNHEAVVSFELDDPTVTLYALTNAAPKYWTTFDGTYAVFDSYNADVDTILAGNKTLVFGQTKPSIHLDDTTTINLPKRFITLLRNEARSMSFALFKGGDVPPKVEQAAMRSRVRLQRTNYIERRNKDLNLPNYGRKS